jgi:dCTP deaminase
MPILSDGSIRAAIEAGDIRLDPAPEDLQYQPASLDICLGADYSNEHTGDILTDCSELVIQPHTFYLGTTEETVSLPADVSAMVSGRSSLGRKGLIIHATAGWIDAGFEGEITLEIYNFMNTPIVLTPGQRVGQLIFFQMDAPAEEPYGTKATSKYQNQRGPTPSRLENDPDYRH